MKKLLKQTIFMLLLGLILCGCGSSSGAEKDLLLHLGFNEGQGTAVQDLAGQEEEAQVSYQFTRPLYTNSMDPEWRTAGAEDGSLLFDGCSTFVSYKPEDLCISGSAFTVTAWAAPRAFEWDDPQAASQGTQALTAIVSQFSKSKKQGFILGYQRFGRLCFEVGTGEDWITLWADVNLDRDAWNHVAAVFDGKNGRISLYKNGVLAASCEIPPGSEIAPASRKDLLIGRSSEAEAIAAGTYNMFSGLMDEVKLYGRALSPEELEVSQVPDLSYEDIALSNILTEDIYKTQYHGGPYQHWMNEPHAPMYYNGTYHLFFQQNIVGTYWRNICWGHLVSRDMVSWRPVRESIVPTENSVVPDGVWSGNAAFDKNGVPLLFFTAGNDSFRQEGMISNQNIGIAYPSDLKDPDLTEWTILDTLAVEQQPGQGRAGEFRDPYVWEEDGTWYMLVCSGSAGSPGGSALLYETSTLELKSDGSIDMDWQYKGPVYEMEDQPMTYGTSWELPILIPLTSEDGSAAKWAFFISPAPAGLADNKVYYFLGSFDHESGKFTPDPAYDHAPALLDYGDNVFTGPSIMKDPVSGSWYMFSIMQDKRSGAEEGSAGWAHCVGLPRKIGLNDDGSDLTMAPGEALSLLEESTLLDLADTTLGDANAALKDVKGDLLHIRLRLDASDTGDSFGITVKSDGGSEKTEFIFDPAADKISARTGSRGSASSAAPQGGPLSLKDGIFEADLYIDRSLAEAFFCGSKAISIRSYSPYEAQGIELTGENSLKVLELKVVKMGSIYD